MSTFRSQLAAFGIRLLGLEERATKDDLLDAAREEDDRVYREDAQARLSALEEGLQGLRAEVALNTIAIPPLPLLLESLTAAPEVPRVDQ